MKYLYKTVLVLISIFLLLSCGVEKDEIGVGCISASDCGEERLCVDRVCRFAEDAELISPAERTALVVFQSLKEKTAAHFDMALPLLEDYGWGFDLSGDGLYNEQQLAFMNEHRDGLYADYDQLLEKIDLRNAEYVSFTPGVYQPVPEGEQRAIRDLDCLLDSWVTYELEGETRSLIIRRLIRLRDRWCLFDLTP